MEKFTNMNSPIINIEGVNVHLTDQKIFNNINLKIEKGEFLYLIGDTGSGKSSLLKTLYAELKVTAGKLSVSNIDLTKIKEKEVPTLRRKLGIVFQDFQLLTDRTVFKNLEFVLTATGWNDKNKMSERIEEVLDSVHLEGVKDKMPYELSGGEQQRAAIARSLLNHPDIILADEPTGNLDPEKSERIIQLLKEINTKGTTVLIATHDYPIIKKYQARTIKCTQQQITEVDPQTL
tara:strand:- start:7129 stop:7830 length:702 start_codon:yes stop_codon:yes gene_type:complete